MLDSFLERSPGMQSLDLFLSREESKQNDGIAWIDFLRRIVKIGELSFIQGLMGRGKTDFALAVAEHAVHHGIVDVVITNIKLKVKYKRIKYFYKISQLNELVETKGRKLVIIDEAGIGIDSRRATSRINVFFKKTSRLIRKKRGHLMIISQKERDIDIALNDLVSTGIHKVSKTIALVQFATSRKQFKITDVKRTKIKFNTNDVANLIFDEEVKKIATAKRTRRKNYTAEQKAELYDSIRIYYQNNYGKIAADGTRLATYKDIEEKFQVSAPIVREALK